MSSRKSLLGQVHVMGPALLGLSTCKFQFSISWWVRASSLLLVNVEPSGWAPKGGNYGEKSPNLIASALMYLKMQENGCITALHF